VAALILTKEVVKLKKCARPNSERSNLTKSEWTSASSEKQATCRSILMQGL
jgi:hypothetical protein